MNDLVSRQAVKDWLEKWRGYLDDDMIARMQIGTKDIEPAQQWTPCSERLPTDSTEVFVYLFDSPSPYIAWIVDTHWYTEDFEVDREYEPIAWMPLPEPYKAERSEE